MSLWVILIIILLTFIIIIEVEWNSIKRTKTLYETLTPNFNELLYFQFPFDSDLQKNNIKAFKEWLKNEMQNKFNVRIDLWAAYNGCNENLGSCNFFLQELSSQQRQELDYFYDEEDLNFNYKSRQFVGKKRLVSAFRSQESIIELACWFMPDIPLTHELKDLNKKIVDNYPYEYISLSGSQVEETDLYKNWKATIHKNFSVLQDEFTQRRMQRMETGIFQQDQYRMKHLVVKFLAKISPPQLVNNINQPKEEELDEEALKKLKRLKAKQKRLKALEKKDDDEEKEEEE